MKNVNGENGKTSGAAAVLLLRMAAALVCLAALWDVAGRLVGMPSWGHAVSYVAISAGIALGCLSVLLHVLTTPRVARRRAVMALRLVALGVLLGAWLLRGHAEIPADPPIVVTQVAVAIVLLLSAWRHG